MDILSIIIISNCQAPREKLEFYYAAVSDNLTIIVNISVVAFSLFKEV